MIRILTIDGRLVEYTDVINMMITVVGMQVSYQHPNEDAYVVTFKFDEIDSIYIADPLTIKII